MTELRELLLLLERAGPDVRSYVLGKSSAGDIRAFADEWSWGTHGGQKVPRGDWRIWMMLAGRGFGKTRTGAEWVLEQSRKHPDARIALVGSSLDEVAKVMVEGESGLLACARTGEDLVWKVSAREVHFPSGAVAFAYSGANPGRLRGPQHNFAWADEIGKWRKAAETWDNLEMGMRIGDQPRIVVTTTPGQAALLTRIKKLPKVASTGGRTSANPHLPPAFIEAMEGIYGGTRLGRQELDGELIGEADGALWTRDVIERCRTAPLCWPADGRDDGPVVRVVVGVDPPAGTNGDACGIVVCARLADGRGAVLADCSVSGRRPEGWARAVTAAAEHWSADRVVAEANNGGDMVGTVLTNIEAGLPVKLVRASRGKVARAEPIAAAFEAGRCVLAGRFPALEDELTQITSDGFKGSGSPDRADAMVWALSELMMGVLAVPRVRGL